MATQLLGQGEQSSSQNQGVFANPLFLRYNFDTRRCVATVNIS